MRTLAVALLLLPLAGAAPARACTDPPPVRTRLGVMADRLPSPALRTAMEQRLGVRYARPNAALIGARAPQPQNASSQAAGLRTVLTIVNRARARGASAPPADLAAYAEGVRRQLRLNRPALAVIEDEELALRSYAGTPQQYLAQLAAAVAAGHAEGLPVTNGGLASNATALLTWDDLWSRGRRRQADDYARRAFNPSERAARRILSGLPTVSEPSRPVLAGQPALRALLERARVLVAGYRDGDMDYVNFHWDHADPKALRQSIAFLERATGKRAVTNGITVRNPLPVITTSVLDALVAEGVPYAIWDAADGKQPSGLYDAATRVLRPNGEAFAAFARAHVLGRPAADAKPCRPVRVRFVKRIRHTRLVRVRLHCRTGGRTCGGQIRARGVRRGYALEAGRTRTYRIRTRGRRVRVRRDSGRTYVAMVPWPTTASPR